MVDRSPPYCKVCNGVQGSSLASECPGSPLSNQQAGWLYRGDYDFIGGDWVNLRAPAVKPVEPPPPPPQQPTHVSATVEVELPPDEEEPSHSADNKPVIVPVPVPMPSAGGTDTQAGSADPDPVFDVHVNRK